MGILDRWARRKGYISAEEASEQINKRKSMRRRFDAAKIDRLTAGFVSAPTAIDLDIVNSFDTLLGRARHLAINNDYVRRYISIVRNNVVGPKGITLVGQLRTATGDVDTVGNDAIEAAWKDWGQFGTPDISGKLSWKGCQDLYTESLARDGEVLVLLHPKADNAHGFAIQFIDPLMLDPKLNETTRTGNDIVMGVEMSKTTRRAVAYWLLVEPSIQPHTSIIYNNHNGRQYHRVPAELIIHRFNPEYCTQTRGYTPLASSIAGLNMLGGYEEAELVRKRASSALMGFYKSSGDEEFEGDDKDALGNVISEFEPGIMEKLPMGVDVEFNNPTPNATDYAVFVKATLRGIAAGLGLNYNTLSNDLEGVNFSSIRTGVLEDREAWKCKQEQMIDQFIWPVYRAWLRMAALSGSIRIKGQALSPDKALDRFSAVAWQARRWEWVDPTKDSTANLALISANIRSTSDVIRDRGQDPDEVFAEIAREKEKMESLGITPEKAITTANDMTAQDSTDEGDQPDQE